MKEAKRYELKWGGRDLIIETGQLAGLADGSCKVQYGDTVVLATACMSDEPRPDMSYFPLSVEYRENMYAAGKISGSRFVKREGRPSEKAVLTARLVDRSIRPLFDHKTRNDLQVVVSVLSFDNENDPDVPGLIGAVCALNLSHIPFKDPLAGCSVAVSQEGELILNPTFAQKEEAKATVFVSGNGKEAVMIETEGSEANEDEVYKAIELGVKNTAEVIEFLAKIKQELGKEKKEPKGNEFTEEEQTAREETKKKVEEFVKESMPKILGIKDKQERRNAEAKLKEELKYKVSDQEESYAFDVFEELMEIECRNVVLDKGERIDGRAFDEIRPLSSIVGALPRTHGSAVFQRGETQVMSIVTLASPGAEQIIDGMEEESKKRYMHHYNFPGFSVGEVSPFRGAGRREIGHGALAEKALEPMIPSKEDFPYTIRVVSEVLSSNGSSSQASACGSSLALMDAGVPIKKPVAGIAMGLITSEDGSKSTILSDIQGVEDHAGDMDFKVAGTKDGITAVQMDIKLDGITLEVIKEALNKAKEARLQILESMLSTLAEPRKELSKHAPQIEKVKIDEEKIRDLIGPGGKVINEIIDATDTQIDIEDDGWVFVTAVDGEGMKKALAMINDVTREVKEGEIIEGEVVKIVKDRNTGADIGAIVQLTANQDGMVHISRIAHERVEKIEDYIKMGEKVKVKVTGVDKERGRIELSRKDLLERPTGAPQAPAAPASKPGLRKKFTKKFDNNN